VYMVQKIGSRFSDLDELVADVIQVEHENEWGGAADAAAAKILRRAERNLKDLLVQPASETAPAR
jgi:hypothetical protein